MKKFSKIKRLVVTGCAGITLLGAAGAASAAENEFTYSFEIQPYYGNAYSDRVEYRQTSSTSNQWMVNLQFSSEGSGTITNFWLDKSGTRVSEYHGVKQGTGKHTYDAYSTANHEYVRLGAENNNYNGNSYTASGVWDEEGY